MKRRILTIISLGAVVALTTMGASSCSTPTNAQDSGQKITQQAFSQQSAAVPYPVSQLKDSLERRNLRERLLRTNRPDAISYLYVLSFGKTLGYYTIKGKVTSTQSQMTTDQIVTCRRDGDGTCAGSGGDATAVVDAPGDDGSYGANEPGIFFFTTEGAMVTTSLDYIVSDQPLPFNVPSLNHTAKN